MKLYTSEVSPFSARVRMLVYHKGIEDKVEFSPPTAPPGSDEWKRVNPIGKVPALEADGRVLVESEVILEYLEDKFPEPPLRPHNLEDRALGRILNRICDLYIFEPMIPLFRQLSAKPRDTAIIEENLARLVDGVSYLEALWPDTKGPFVFGAEPSLADCAVPSILFFVNWVPAPFGLTDAVTRQPKLSAYWQAVTREPLAARIIEELQRGLDAMQKKS